MVPTPSQDCGPMQVELPTVECEEVVEERCVQLPEVEEAEVEAQQCRVGVGSETITPSTDTEISLFGYVF